MAILLQYCVFIVHGIIIITYTVSQNSVLCVYVPFLIYGVQFTKSIKWVTAASKGIKYAVWIRSDIKTTRGILPKTGVIDWAKWKILIMKIRNILYLNLYHILTQILLIKVTDVHA